MFICFYFNDLNGTASQNLIILQMIAIPSINSNQSSFRPSDSSEYQPLLVVHDMYASFYCCQFREITGIFLYIPQAFE